MASWVEAVAGGVMGLCLIGAIFWFAFRGMPDSRSDGGFTRFDDPY